VSALTFTPGTVTAMTTYREVPVDPDLLKLATELGFTELHQIHRHFGLSPLFYARWRGAPVAISHLIAIDGPMEVAFYKGPADTTKPENIEGTRSVERRWDDILDTDEIDLSALLVIAKAMLEFRANGREILYRDNAMPDLPPEL
jgi:hypothetical protein